MQERSARESKKSVVQLVTMGENEMVVKLDGNEVGTQPTNRVIIRVVERGVGVGETAGICCDGLCCDGLKAASAAVTQVIQEEAQIPVVSQIRVRRAARRAEPSA